MKFPRAKMNGMQMSVRECCFACAISWPYPMAERQMDNYKKELYDFLCGFVTEQRVQKFENVIHQRTRYITVAVEDVYQPHNASAVLRSAECFGIQDVHIIENKNKYKPTEDISLGSHQWLTLTRHNRSEN